MTFKLVIVPNGSTIVIELKKFLPSKLIAVTSPPKSLTIMLALGTPLMFVRPGPAFVNDEPPSNEYSIVPVTLKSIVSTKFNGTAAINGLGAGNFLNDLTGTTCLLVT